MSNDPDVNQAAKETVFVFMKPPPTPSQPEEDHAESEDQRAEVGDEPAAPRAVQGPVGPRPVGVEPGDLSEATSKKPRLFLMLLVGMLMMSAFVVVALVFAAIIAVGVLSY